jgi:predicted RNA-binding Zn ribbon-like protein
MAADTWRRLKVCASDRCRRAFYDRSRARSGKWCSMRACGNRAKQRAWRGRQAELKTIR